MTTRGHSKTRGRCHLRVSPRSFLQPGLPSCISLGPQPSMPQPSLRPTSSTCRVMPETPCLTLLRGFFPSWGGGKPTRTLFPPSLDLPVGFWQKLSTTTDRHIYLLTKALQSQEPQEEIHISDPSPLREKGQVAQCVPGLSGFSWRLWRDKLSRECSSSSLSLPSPEFPALCWLRIPGSKALSHCGKEAGRTGAQLRMGDGPASYPALPPAAAQAFLGKGRL